MKRVKRIGILTGGGDAPGLNAVVRGVVKSALHTHGIKVFGFKDAFRGLVLGQGRWLTWDDVSGILTLGGTILGTTNRDNPFDFIDDHRHPDRRRNAAREVVRHYRRLKLDALVAVGGDGTLQCCHKLSKLGLNIVGVPKTIDNDVRGTDLTFGFNTAAATATEAVDKIHSTAFSHHRIMLVEVMGRTAGWLALFAGIAGGGDVILLPEIPYRIDAIVRQVGARAKRGKHFTIVVVSEGARPVDGEVVVRQRVAGSPEPVRLGGVSQVLAQQLEEATGIEARATVLGYLQRGGGPTAFDRYLATQFATRAVELIAARKFQRMVALRQGQIRDTSLTTAGGGPRLVPRQAPAITMARRIGTSFGDE